MKSAYFTHSSQLVRAVIPAECSAVFGLIQSWNYLLFIAQWCSWFLLSTCRRLLGSARLSSDSLLSDQLLLGGNRPSTARHPHRERERSLSVFVFCLDFCSSQDRTSNFWIKQFSRFIKNETTSLTKIPFPSNLQRTASETEINTTVINKHCVLSYLLKPSIKIRVQTFKCLTVSRVNLFTLVFRKATLGCLLMLQL